MKRNLIISILFFYHLSLHSQINWEFQSISGGSAHTITTVDIDGDGDLDVAAATHSTDSLKWLENDGLGNFDIEHIISNESGTLMDLKAIDMDGDGDIDILTVDRDEKELAWFENVDGFGDFGVRIIISDGNELEFIDQATTADLDGDGDLDVLTNTGHWYEHIDGNGNFGPPTSVIPGTSWTREVRAGDVDGDGDHDFFLTNSLNGSVMWAENLNGMGTFGPPTTIIEEISGWITLTDYDLDNDLDIITADNGEIILLRNLDGLGNFGNPETVVDIGNQGIYSVYHLDFDFDGDKDIYFAGSLGPGLVGWFENIGNNVFGEFQIIFAPRSPRSIAAADVDNDGDMDALFVSYFDRYIMLAKNITPLSVNDNPLETSVVFPNPVSNRLFFYIPENVTYKKALLVSGNGQIVYETFGRSINMSSFSPGVYFLKMFSEEGISIKKVVKE